MQSLTPLGVSSILGKNENGLIAWRQQGFAGWKQMCNVQGCQSCEWTHSHQSCAWNHAVSLHTTHCPTSTSMPPWGLCIPYFWCSSWLHFRLCQEVTAEGDCWTSGWGRGPFLFSFCFFWFTSLVVVPVKVTWGHGFTPTVEASSHRDVCWSALDTGRTIRHTPHTPHRPASWSHNPPPAQRLTRTGQHTDHPGTSKGQLCGNLPPGSKSWWSQSLP